MDEHVAVSCGSIGRLHHDFIDENHKGLSFWIDKHNQYSDRQVWTINAPLTYARSDSVGDSVARRQFFKRSIYDQSPLFLRALAYWFLRYFVLLGFLDGRAGFVFHILQGFWYRLIVDAKLYEQRMKRSSTHEDADLVSGNTDAKGER